MSETGIRRPDPIDGLPAMPVGDWTERKHALLKFYVEISSGARKNFIEGPGGATFIDLFCASGRAYIRGTNAFIDGSPLVAWKAAVGSGAPFTEVHLNDRDSAQLRAACERLRCLSAPVVEHGGEVDVVVHEIVDRLNPHGLHFAFVDPFSLGLPFSVFEKLASLKRIDLLVHVSVMELQRNFDIYTPRVHSPLDDFAPGWREKVNLKQRAETARREFIDYWVGRLGQLGFSGDVRFELITGPNNQPLYWLVLIAKHELATKFWKKAVQHGKTRDLFGDF